MCSHPNRALRPLPMWSALLDVSLYVSNNRWCSCRGQPTSLGYRDINIIIKYEGFLCEIQVQLAPLLKAKHEYRSVYQLVRSLDLEDEVHVITHAALVAACSPGTRMALGVLRFFVASYALVLSEWYIIFAFLYHDPSLSFLGAVR